MRVPSITADSKWDCPGVEAYLWPAVLPKSIREFPLFKRLNKQPPVFLGYKLSNGAVLAEKCVVAQKWNNFLGLSRANKFRTIKIWLVQKNQQKVSALIDLTRDPEIARFLLENKKAILSMSMTPDLRRGVDLRMRQNMEIDWWDKSIEPKLQKIVAQGTSTSL